MTYLKIFRIYNIHLQSLKLARTDYELLKKIGTEGEIAFVTDQFSNQAIRVSEALVKNRVDLLNKQIEIAKSTQEKQVLWFVSILLILIIIGIVIYSYQKNKLNAHLRADKRCIRAIMPFISYNSINQTGCYSRNWHLRVLVRVVLVFRSSRGRSNL